MAEIRHKKLADQLRQAIDDCGLTRYEIAKQTGIDESALAKFYNGHRGLSMMSRLNLGRAAARAGRFEEADELLREAGEGFREIGAASFQQEVHARIAEAAVLAGDHERALREVEADPPPALRAALDRVRGYAYLQLDERDAADSEFEKSVEVARGSDTLYELALSLRAQEALRGESADDDEAQRLLEALDIVFLPDVPAG